MFALFGFPDNEGVTTTETAYEAPGMSEKAGRIKYLGSSEVDWKVTPLRGIWYILQEYIRDCDCPGPLELHCGSDAFAKRVSLFPASTETTLVGLGIDTEGSVFEITRTLSTCDDE